MRRPPTPWTDNLEGRAICFLRDFKALTRLLSLDPHSTAHEWGRGSGTEVISGPCHWMKATLTNSNQGLIPSTVLLPRGGTARPLSQQTPGLTEQPSSTGQNSTGHHTTSLSSPSHCSHSSFLSPGWALMLSHPTAGPGPSEGAQT